MVNFIQSNLVVENKKFCIIVSRFNEFIGRKLLDGAIDELLRHNTKETDIDVVWVPGAFEIPLVAQKVAKSTKYNAVIALGAVRAEYVPVTYKPARNFLLQKLALKTCEFSKTLL